MNWVISLIIHFSFSENDSFSKWIELVFNSVFCDIVPLVKLGNCVIWTADVNCPHIHPCCMLIVAVTCQLIVYWVGLCMICLSVWTQHYVVTISSFIFTISLIINIKKNITFYFVSSELLTLITAFCLGYELSWVRNVCHSPWVRDD